jgi:hypothetical protein
MSLRKIFHNGRETRAGWRLLLFCALFLAIGHFVTKALERLRLPDYPPLHPMDLILGEGGTLLVALIATFVMAGVERCSWLHTVFPEWVIYLGDCSG